MRTTFDWKLGMGLYVFICTVDRMEYFLGSERVAIVVESLTLLSESTILGLDVTKRRQTTSLACLVKQTHQYSRALKDFC